MSMDGSGQAADVQLLINEARTLVSQLYDPANAGNPTKIKLIQEHLQSLQKSPQAWLIANSLLSDTQTDLRFFGALTFTVKINLDWPQLNENEALELVGRLIDHYVFLVNTGEQALVVRKLASSLATIFLKSNAPWTHALWSIAASLANGKYLSEEQCQSLDLSNTVLPAMSESQVVALLYFSNILAEEINKWNSDTRRTGENKRAVENLKDALSIVEFVLRHLLQREASGSSVPDATPGIEAINSYHSWLGVRGVNQLRGVVPATQLASTTSLVIESLKAPNLSRTAAQVLVELIDWRDCVFDQHHIDSILEYIVSESGTAHVASLVEGDFEDENMTFLELLLEYSTSRQRELLSGSSDPRHEKVLAFLHAFFKAPGYAAVEDSASPLVLEWWTELADDLQEIFFDAEGETSLDFAKRHLAQAALECFEKMKYPNMDELQNWNDDERSEFGAFRRDVCDFLLAIYPMLGVELIQVFQQRAVSSLVTQDWITFEAAIFCIAQLSEAVDENQHADACLNAIFFCDEFARLCLGEGVAIPDTARQTLVDMLGKYQSYFERTHDLLPRVLTFLFASLEVGPCAPTASKSISHLCNSCRKALTFELPTFVDQFEHFQFKPTATALTMEKVLEGIAAIMQTLPSDEEKSQNLERILSFFRQQADVARDEAARGLIEPATGRGQLVLRCLASIGKGLRADGEIVLDSSDGNVEEPYPPTFWNTNNTAQNLIMQCMQLLMTNFPLDITMIEAACDILKAGYTEKTGPYVFPPMLTVEFVKSLPLGSAGADVVMGTASAFLASHSTHPQHIRDEAVALIIHVYDTFCWMHEKPNSYDPEVANSGIDFLTRLLPKYHLILFALTSTPQELGQSQPSHDGAHPQRPPVLQAILNFTLIALQGQDPLPLRSASQFWVSVLNLPNRANPNEADPVHTAVQDYLPALCRILITRVSGQCSRSDLDHLAEVLRKVIFKYQGLARPHLTAALEAVGTSAADQANPSVVSPQEKQRFLASLIAARSAKAQTVQLVRSFWIKCRGAGFDYVS